MDLSIGDRIVVVNSLMGIYDGKKGSVKRVINNEYIEVVLDINRGTVSEVTLLPIHAVELIKIEQQPTIKQSLNTEVKTDCESIDDRMDNMETLLSKYNLSIKDGCGFMYIYDFLDNLNVNWNLISTDDKKLIAYYLLGEKFSLDLK